jgi:hypothetical protein
MMDSLTGGGGFQGSSAAQSASSSGDVTLGGVQMGAGFFNADPLNVGLIAGAVAIAAVALIILRNK